MISGPSYKILLQINQLVIDTLYIFVGKNIKKFSLRTRSREPGTIFYLSNSTARSIKYQSIDQKADCHANLYTTIHNRTESRLNQSLNDGACGCSMERVPGDTVNFRAIRYASVSRFATQAQS